MALLRRGSSRISEQNFEGRLQREKAKTGAVTASLAWNDPSDLDLHADIKLARGGRHVINYRNKNAAGGVLDVDMHVRDEDTVDEPVENIFWKKPPAGDYSILAKLYKKRGDRTGPVPFRVMLKREDEDPLSVEGAVELGNKSVTCFQFTVNDDGDVVMVRKKAMQAGGDHSAMKRAGAMKKMKARPVMKAMKKMKVMKVMKVMKAMKAKKPMRKRTVATGKKAKVQVYKGLKVKTKGGLKKDDLVKSKDRKIVSRKKSEAGKNSKWARATAKARAVKGYTGFKAIKKGSSFYAKAKELMTEI